MSAQFSPQTWHIHYNYTPQSMNHPPHNSTVQLLPIAQFETVYNPMQSIVAIAIDGFQVIV